VTCLSVSPQVESAHISRPNFLNSSRPAREKERITNFDGKKLEEIPPKELKDKPLIIITLSGHRPSEKQTYQLGVVEEKGSILTSAYTVRGLRQPFISHGLNFEE